MSPTILTGTEAKRLETLEASIRRGQKAFVETGNALATIRDERLYRSDFSTFQDYCKERWGWDRQRAIQLINAAAVVKALPENVNHGLQTERQARELSKVEPAKREEVLALASQGGNVTAKSIKAAALMEQCAVETMAPEIEVPAEECPSRQTGNPWANRIYQLVNDIADEPDQNVKSTAIALLEKQINWLKGN